MKLLTTIVLAALTVSCVSTAQLNQLRSQIREIANSGEAAVAKLEEVDAVVENFVDDAEEAAWSNAEIVLAALGALTGTGVLTGKATSVIRDRKRKLRNEPTAIPPLRPDPSRGPSNAS